MYVFYHLREICEPTLLECLNVFSDVRYDLILLSYYTLLLYILLQFDVVFLEYIGELFGCVLDVLLHV